MLTRQQLYELYHSGPERMLHFVEQLLAHLAEVERHVGHRQQYTIDRLLKDWRAARDAGRTLAGAIVEAGDVELPTARAASKNYKLNWHAGMNKGTLHLTLERCGVIHTTLGYRRQLIHRAPRPLTRLGGRAPYDASRIGELVDTVG